jgi:hypothetical protein
MYLYISISIQVQTVHQEESQGTYDRIFIISATKTKDLDVEDLEMSQYLCDPRFNKTEREILFKLRSRTIQTKENFQNAYMKNDMLCELCKLFPCTQFHPLQCPSLLMTRIMVDKNVNISEKHVYGSVDQQLLFVKIYTQFWDLRQEIMQDK